MTLTLTFLDGNLFGFTIAEGSCPCPHTYKPSSRLRQVWRFASYHCCLIIGLLWCSLCCPVPYIYFWFLNYCSINYLFGTLNLLFPFPSLFGLWYCMYAYSILFPPSLTLLLQRLASFIQNVLVHLPLLVLTLPPHPLYVSGRHFFEARGSVR